MRDPRSDIVRSLADEACKRITTRAIASLNAQAAQLSGDDSKLGSVWDEFCVQVQDGDSMFWDAYELTVKHAIQAELVQLPQHERDAIWLQSDLGWDWLWDFENPDDSKQGEPVRHEKAVKVPVDDSDSTEHVYREYILQCAEDYSSPSIDDYKAWRQLSRAELDRQGLS